MIPPKTVVIVGAGPAGLMAAVQLVDKEVNVLFVDHHSAAARKFLVAGNGGFNLTNSEELPSFLEKYNRSHLKEAVKVFTPEQFIAWLKRIGVETYVGSSGKIFPVPGIKPIQVLNSWLKALDRPNIKWLWKAELVDFSSEGITVQTEDKQEDITADAIIFALGGASWPKTGATGTWLKLFKKKGIAVEPFQASNSGVQLKCPLPDLEGKYIKNVRCKSRSEIVAGDLVLTHYGLEGKPVYGVNKGLRESHFKDFSIDFKPQLTKHQIEEKLQSAKTVKAGFKSLKINEVVYSWLFNELSKSDFNDPVKLAENLKKFQPEINGLRPVDEVISTVGGLNMNEVTNDFQLKNYPTIYCVGEMLDWDAPTGGYLLQGCVATGYVAGKAISQFLED